VQTHTELLNRPASSGFIVVQPHCGRRWTLLSMVNGVIRSLDCPSRERLTGNRAHRATLPFVWIINDIGTSGKGNSSERFGFRLKLQIVQVDGKRWGGPTNAHHGSACKISPRLRILDVYRNPTPTRIIKVLPILCQCRESFSKPGGLSEIFCYTPSAGTGI